MGISLGLHIMPGVTKFAVDAGYSITVDGDAIQLADIVDISRLSHGGAICPGCTFYQLNMSKRGAQQWYDAYYQQLAGWAVTFVKADFLPAKIDSDNIRGMANAITKTNTGITLSIHGVSSPEEAARVGPQVNMYRITSDVHDSWNAVRSGFAASTEYAGHGLEGAPGLQGHSWPNHDMLPLGYQKAPNGQNYSNPNGLSLAEQRTLITLWGITRSPLIYGGKLSNMTDETVSLLTKHEVLLLNQNATAPPRSLDSSSVSVFVDAHSDAHLGYQGLGYTVAPCNSSDDRQRWNASKLKTQGQRGRVTPATSAVNVHKSFDKNGTWQQVCMRLMVYSHNCQNMNWTKMDLMDCHINNCDGNSILWNLPALSGEAGPITSELTGHCLTVDENDKISTEPCLGQTLSSRQAWKLQPSGDGPAEIAIVDASSGKCFAETLPTSVDPATVWVGVVNELTFVALFNTGDADATVAVAMAELGLSPRPSQAPNRTYFVRDVWEPSHPARQVAGTSILDARVTARGVVLYEVSATSASSSTEAHH
jgi:hypothetical protein